VLPEAFYGALIVSRSSAFRDFDSEVRSHAFIGPNQGKKLWTGTRPYAKFGAD